MIRAVSLVAKAAKACEACGMPRYGQVVQPCNRIAASVVGLPLAIRCSLHLSMASRHQLWAVSRAYCEESSQIVAQFNQVLIWPHVYPHVKIGVWCIGPNDPSLAPKTYFLYSLHAQCILTLHMSISCIS